MKTVFSTLLGVFTLLAAYPQGNHVFSGGELVNYSVMNVPAGGNQVWSTDRTSLPGYFSAVTNANFTGCSDAAHIDGYIKKYGNNAFVFPVGSSNDLRTLEISQPAVSSDAYATAWIEGDPGVTADPTSPNAGFHPVTVVKAPITAVSNAGQWDWQVGNNANLGAGTTGTGSGLTITVSIPDMTLFAAAANLRLVGWDGFQWVNLSSGPTASGNTENSTLSGTMIEGITAIGIGTVAMALPLHLQYFNAVPDNCDAVLNWQSLNEINTKHFVIEQSSDNIRFTAIATVKAKGRAGVNNYRSVVSQPSGISYYRLKMVDNDGTYTYSGTVVCKTSCGGNEFMIVYPNPVEATGTLHVSFNTQYRGKALLIITNMLGQRFFTMPLTVTGSANLASIEVGRFASGTYLLSVEIGAGQRIGSIQKFIKQ